MAQHNDSKPASPGGKAASEAVSGGSSGAGAGEKDAAADVGAPYGTRSRNRNGNSRPNYAEDKDVDVDMYEIYSPEKKERDGDGGKKSSSRQAHAAGNGDTGRTNGGSRKSAADDHKSGATQNGHRDPNSGSGSAASQAAQGQGQAQAQSQASGATQSSSRKRKAAGGQNGGSAAATSKKSANGTTVAQASPGVNWPDTNMLTFENSHGRPENGRMVADNGTALAANDHVYLVCEPPGEPYYLGRIMEFLHQKNDSSKPVDAMRVNWYYRPKDIGRKVQDTRLVFATMHSDITPLTALRGKCQIRHRCEIDNMDEYRKTPDSFWFEKLYDRYIQKNYDLIPTRSIVNVPEKVKKVLDERWKYVLVELGRGKELTSAVKSCKRCSGYCASNDSVDCAVCQCTYHMNCVNPPLLKKPSRGFAWACGPCNRAQERKIEARHTPHTVHHGDIEDDECMDDDDDDAHGVQTDRTTPADDDVPHLGTAEQIYQASLWPYRYLGMHCRPEDALDYDDRIYPRASTRVGPRNQANVLPWPGRPVEYVKPLEVKKPGRKEPRLSKEALAAQEAEKARRGNRPKWIQDEPSGYVARGEDYSEDDPRCTATPLWIPPPSSAISSERITRYVDKAIGLAKKLELPDRSTNLRDAAVQTLFREAFDADKAFRAIPEIPRSDFKEPSLTPVEQKRFEEAVSKFGSELHSVMKYVKTMTPGEVVRYYYKWKKTDRGQQVWGNYPARKGKKQARQAEAAASRFADDVADADDDSAFDAEKAVEKKRGFVCQFCNTTNSRQWRRAPSTVAGLVPTENGSKANGKDKSSQSVVALCRRCAELWRRYAIQWEDIDEVARKVAQAGGRAWKRKQDEELLKELQAAQELGFLTPERASTPTSSSQPTNGQEPPRKKLKNAPEKDVDAAMSEAGSVTGSSHSAPPPPPPPPPAAAAAPAAPQPPPPASATAPPKKKEKVVEAVVVPEIPKPRTLPCAICDQMEPLGDQHLSCRECRLTVHRNCYGVVDTRVQSKWTCDMCVNDKSPQVSIHYKCVLCPVEYTEHDLVDQLKLTHHKKKMTEKERERERLEVQQARKAVEFYRKKQEELNRPVNPREPLKRTADNNWVHVTCAVWTAEVRFGNAKAMGPSEGIPSIPRSKYDEVCQACNQKGGACVSCHHCRAPYHVECARQHGHVLGFDITPIKGSRRDQFNIVTLNGESGSMAALLWCKDHVPKTIVHRMHDMVNGSGLNALQFYVQNFKQADLTLTGTVRKANLLTMAAKMSGAPTQTGNRRASTTTTAAGTGTGATAASAMAPATSTSTSTSTPAPTTAPTATTTVTPLAAAATNGWTQPMRPRNPSSINILLNGNHLGDKICISCGTDVALQWWPIEASPDRNFTNGLNGSFGSEAQKFMEQRKFQCHKCHKLQRELPSPEPRFSKSSPPAPAPPRPQLAESGLLASVSPFRGSPPMPDYRDARPPSLSRPLPTPTAAPAPAPAQAPPPPPPPPAAPNPAPLGNAHGHGQPISHSLSQPHPLSHTHAWPQPPSAHSIASLTAGPPPPAIHPMPGPIHPSPLAAAHRPISVPHAYAPPVMPPRPTPFGDWGGHRPGSRHESPPRHLNGGGTPTLPPPLHAPPNPNPPSLASLAPLRPPVMNGPPPPGPPMSNGLSHGHTPPGFANGMPMSPRRLSGPGPSTPYISPYHGSVGHVGHAASAHGTPHGLGSLAQSQPPPPPPPSRADLYAHSLHPHRPPPFSAPQNSPPVSRNGLPAPLEPHLSSASSRPRFPTSDRPSAASASPSLRNLLS